MGALIRLETLRCNAYVTLTFLYKIPKEIVKLWKNFWNISIQYDLVRLELN